MKEYFNISLPKWPGLLVVGEKVTSLQAQEILIRTNYFPCYSNDRDFEKEINSIMFGIKCDSMEISDQLPYDQREEELKKLGIINLEYLSNSQILSSWIGGPHGWCDWNGNIFTANYNIGKYPSISEVFEEWVKIAATFPFLNLKSQLLNCEIDESYDEQILPVIEFIIENGNVTMNIPTTIITQPMDLTEEHLKKRFQNKYGERGCNLNQFDYAFQYVKKKMQ